MESMTPVPERPVLHGIGPGMSAQVAAGLALLSVRYAAYDSTFADSCLKVAEKLYGYAKEHFGEEDVCVDGLYPCSSQLKYIDALAMAAIALHYATYGKCDIDKDADVWVIPSQFMEAEKTVYIWKGDMYSVSSVVELPLGSPMFCEMALGKADSTLSSEEAGENLDIQKTCDENGVLRTWSSNPFQKGDRDAVFVNATILCKDDLLD